jgi:hypothetical protein
MKSDEIVWTCKSRHLSELAVQSNKLRLVRDLAPQREQGDSADGIDDVHGVADGSRILPIHFPYEDSAKRRAEGCVRWVGGCSVSRMSANNPTIEREGRKWKVWIVDETDVTITVRVRPLRVMESEEFTFPFRDEFRAFDKLALAAIDRYLGTARAARA